MVNRPRRVEICAVLLLVGISAQKSASADCPQNPQGPTNDTEIPKAMYPPSWPKSQDIFMRVIKMDPAHVTSWLSASSAASGVDLFDAATIQLPQGSVIVDASVRLRAVEKKPQGSASSYPIELGYWSPTSGTA